MLTDIDDVAGESLARALADRVQYLHLDVRQEDDWRSASVLGNLHGRLDVLVNNAGIICWPRACDESAYVTGSELHVDGGLLAGTAASPSERADHQV